MVELPDELRRRVVKLIDPRLFTDIPNLRGQDFPAWGVPLIIQPSFSFLYGYSESDKKFIALRTNTYGQLLVAGVSPSTNWESTKLSVDENGVYHTFSGQYTRILIINDGPNSAYIAFNRAATTSDFELKSGEWIELPLLVSGLGAICASGETATLRVIVTG